MNKKEFHDLLERYLSGKATIEEQFLLDDLFESFQEDDDKQVFLEAKKGQLRDEMWFAVRDELAGRQPGKTAYLPRMERSDTRSRQTRTWRRSRWAVAATFALIITMGYLAYRFSPTPLNQPGEVTQIVKTTLSGEKSTVTLPDGTKVKLNSGTALRYTDQFSDDVRHVYLSGEAFFEVVKDPEHPFVVETGHFSTTVLGTSFNVRAFEGQRAEVTLVEGKVKVQQGDSDIYLAPSDQLTYNPGTDELNKQQVDVARWVAWKEGTLVFDRMTLAEALPQLERWYGVTITLENQAAGQCLISRGKYKQQSLRQVLESFRFMLNENINFEINDKTVKISGTPCQ